MVQMLLVKLLLAISNFVIALPSFAQTMDNPRAANISNTTGPAAKLQGLTLQADSLERDHEREIIDLVGNVQIVRGDQHISCDHAIIYVRSKKAELYGHVIITTSKQNLNGEEVLLDYETGTGLIKNGYVKSGHIMIEGDVIQKTGDSEFFVTDATYTTCTNCPSTWNFSGQQIRAELGGYAYIKNSIMRIGGVPILWLPYLVVPLKSERQSGLLPPSLGATKDGGFEMEQPYFWAIDRSSDATFSVKHFDQRQWMGLGNYRYVLDDHSGGELDTQWIKDRVFSRRESTFTEFHPEDKNFDRWYLNYQHYLQLDDGWIQRMSLQNVSDLRYLRDFEKETNERNLDDPALENRVSFTKNTDKYSFTIDSSYYINMLRADPLASNNDAVHRLPEISMSQTSEKILDTPFLFSWNFDYTNFARAGRGYDDLGNPTNYFGSQLLKVPKNQGGSMTDDPTCDDQPNCHYVHDGHYNSGDLIRTGQRMDFQPTVNANFRVADALDIVPRLTYRDMRYFFPVGADNEVDRRYLKAELGTKLTFSGLYGDETDTKATRYKHVIEPEVTYTEIPWLDVQKNSFFPDQSAVTPSFGTTTPVSDGDLVGPLGIQYDENDRILDRNLLTFALTNRLIQRFFDGQSNQYRQVVSFKLLQSYNMTQDATLNGQNRWSDLAGLLTVKFDNIETDSSFNYFPDQNVTNIKTRTAFINNKGQFFEVGLDRTYTIVQGQPVIYSNRVEDISFGLGFTSGYVNFAGEVVYDANWKNSSSQAQIKSWGYVAQIKPPGECWQVNINQGQKVGGDTRIDVGFEFNFDGTPKPPPQRSALDKYRSN
jgi:LPS-assembly protein